MTLWYPKIVAMWQVQLKLPSSFLIQTNSRRTSINYYCTLKNRKGPTTTTQILWNILQIKFKMAGDVSFDTEKKQASGIVLQKFILVNLRFLYKDSLERTVFTMLNTHMNQNAQKATLSQPYQFAVNRWQSFLLHRRTPSTSCWMVW